MELINLVDKIITASMTHFYKKWVIRSKGGNNDYYNVESYFMKYGVGKFQFETSWAYIKYNEWYKSDTYVTDFQNIKKQFLDDILLGFDSKMEEIINMTDDDDEDLNKWIEIRNAFNVFKSNDNKLMYLNDLYQQNYYYPSFSESWLFDVFDDRIVSDV